MRADVSLRSSAIVLALAGGLEYGLQLTIPIFLVRLLDVTSFGQYRLLWLLSATVLAILPAFMPQSLFYFLPRAAQGEKRVIIGNVLLYLTAAGCLTGVVVSGWNPLLPIIARDLFFQTQGISAIFLALWVVASMLDVLPTADGHPRWQANATVCLAIFRTLLLVIATLFTANIVWIAVALLVVAAAKISLLCYYAITIGADGKLIWRMSTLKKQLGFALPFALGNALFLTRMQADDWVVASMLTPAMYALFSIAGVFTPVATLIRQPVYNAIMPHLNIAHAHGNFFEMARLIAKSNFVTALLLVPIAGGIFVTAPELVEIVYTKKYQQTAPIMQIYLIGMMMNAFAIGHVLPALEKGRFAAINNGCCLVISVILSILGVKYFGLPGAALGSVSTFLISELWSVKVVAHTLGIKMHQLLLWRELLPTVLGTFCALAGVTIFDTAITGNIYEVVISKAFLYLVIFTVFFLLSGGKKNIGLLMGWS